MTPPDHAPQTDWAASQAAVSEMSSTAPMPATVADVLEQHKYEISGVCACGTDLHGEWGRYKKAWRAHLADQLAAAMPESTKPEFTARQAAAWPEAVDRARVYAPEITSHVDSYWWTLAWADEIRPGRGHDLDATWTDGENLVQIRMDVYGYAEVSVADLSWIHADMDEECPCDHCAGERDEAQA